MLVLRTRSLRQGEQASHGPIVVVPGLPYRGGAMARRLMHFAQFLMHAPTYHSLAMWRHPRTAAAGHDRTRPELYQHIAQVCERGRMDTVFFADLVYISDAYTGSMAPAIRTAAQVPNREDD
jgi:hypothetical protein